jgi:tenascin
MNVVMFRPSIFAAGYLGSSCQQRECPGGCSGHGICDLDNGLCDCHTGFQSEDCSVVSCPNNCNGRGVCNPNTATCECSSLYSGFDCSFEVSSLCRCRVVISVLLR